jgi:hypothetical protein
VFWLNAFHPEAAPISQTPADRNGSRIFLESRRAATIYEDLVINEIETAPR